MMKMLIANWKAYLTLKDVTAWLLEFKQLLQNNSELQNSLQQQKLTIIICPSFIHIPFVKESLKDIQGIAVGSQTVSSMQEGKYTGEVTAKALRDYISYSIIGHSERRSNFPINNEALQQQIDNSSKNKIEPILCVRNENDQMLSGVTSIAYEPVDAIGSGHNADVDDVLEMKKKLNIAPETNFIYGGSVDAENISTYLETGEINGFLVGTASLNATEFFKMAEKMG